MLKCLLILSRKFSYVNFLNRGCFQRLCLPRSCYFLGLSRDNGPHDRGPNTRVDSLWLCSAPPRGPPAMPFLSGARGSPSATDRVVETALQPESLPSRPAPPSAPSCLRAAATCALGCESHIQSLLR
ncbi:hypothetical protein HJG60_008530 [Phyllostomus discolor]|uniref:Uncharacterized protein n=1 Tax=Phyllostomus discolor TaxID=89673 RepID=A0A834DL65_9CHIR|nr:hypothetical protein HJG60_008530 [Phyllostomus discolor]